MLAKELDQAFKNLTTNQEWICLSSVNASGMPETRAMINLANPKLFPTLQKFFADGFAAYFSTNTSSEKMQQLTANSKASAYYYNAGTFEGLLLMGEMEIITDKRMKKDFWQDNWTMYYKKGVDDPDYTLLKLIPRSYKYYNGNFEVKSGDF